MILGFRGKGMKYCNHKRGCNNKPYSYLNSIHLHIDWYNKGNKSAQIIRYLI